MLSVFVLACHIHVFTLPHKMNLFPSKQNVAAYGFSIVNVSLSGFRLRRPQKRSFGEKSYREVMKIFSLHNKTKFSALTDLNHKRGIKNSKQFYFGIRRVINKNVAKNSRRENNFLVTFSCKSYFLESFANCCKFEIALSDDKCRG